MNFTAHILDIEMVIDALVINISSMQSLAFNISCSKISQFSLAVYEARMRTEQDEPELS